MKTALVTGSNGFIGRHMVPALESDGYRCTCWDLPDDDMHVRLRGMSERFDLVVHLAYWVGGRKGINSSKHYLWQNLLLDARLFEWVVQTQQPRVLYFSSSAAYPVSLQVKGGMPLIETDIDLDHSEHPDSDYGWVKLTGERLARNAWLEGVVVHVVRPFSGYGSDQSLDYPFPSFVKRAKSKVSPFPIWGDPTSIRDWVHIDDVVQGSLAVVNADCREPVNVCTGIGTSMNDLANLCMAKAGYKSLVEQVPGSPYGVHTRVGDPSRFFRIYTPKVTIEDGVRRSV